MLDHDVRPKTALRRDAWDARDAIACQGAGSQRQDAKNVLLMNVGMYYCIFENLLVITKIVLKSSDSGNLLTKSITISFYSLQPIGISTSLI